MSRSLFNNTFHDTDHLSVEQDGHNRARVVLDPWRLAEDGGRTKIGLSYAAAEGFTSGLACRQYIQSRGIYSATITPELARCIAVWPEERVHYQSPELKCRVERQLELEARLLANAKMQQAWKDHGAIPDDHGLVQSPDYPLKPYQIVGAALAGEPDGYGLWMDMGTGKTPTAIARICTDASKADSLFKVLIIVPPALKVNWEEEIHKFASVPVHTYIVKGDSNQRTINVLGAIAQAAEERKKLCAIITTYDLAVSSIGLFTMIQWDTTIVDEAQWFKDGSTARAAAMMKLRDKSKKRLVLTGTPFGNTIMDLYTLLEFMELGASGFSTLGEFKRHHAITRPIGTGIDAIVSTRFHDDLKQRIAQRAFIVNKKEVLKDLPDKIYELSEVEMGDQQKKAYKQMADQMIAVFDQMSDSDKRSSTNHILTQLLRLAQITAGFSVIDRDFDEDDEDSEAPPAEIVYFPDNPKIKRLVELANELPPNEKMIIWNKWRPTIRPIVDALEAEGHTVALYRGTNEQKEDAKTRFNFDRSCRFFIANPRSAGAGLNLNGYPQGKEDEYDTNTTSMVHFSYDWSYLDCDQAESRANRIGSRVILNIKRLVVPSSIDMEIYRAIEKKRKDASDIQDIREILRKIVLEL